VRAGLVAVAVALLAVSCGGGATAREAGPAAAPAAPSITIEIERPDEGGGAVPPATPPPAPPPSAATGATIGDPSAAASGPATSVVAHAAVSQVVARAEPSEAAAPVATLANPIRVGTPLVFLAVDTEQATPGWLEVQLPVEPNGTTGWVRRDEVTLFANPYRIEVDRADHLLRVFHEGDLWVETAIAVGTGDTPTPVGEFYLLELLAPPDPSGPYGPYAFGLSGFSEVLDSFGGADTAIIGLHGTDDPDAIGTDVSFGCIRMANDVIEQLAAVVPLGTPVVIT
jgi:lipoprotein-anchoring transpeptidase ErfK/SrfK